MFGRVDNEGDGFDDVELTRILSFVQCLAHQAISQKRIYKVVKGASCGYILQEEESLVTASLQNLIDISFAMEFRKSIFHPELNTIYM